MGKIFKYILIVGFVGLLFAGAFLSNQRGKETIITSVSINSNPEDVEAKKDLAFRYLLQYNYSEALNVLEVIRDLDPKDTIPLNQMVVANIELGNYQEAIVLSKELLKFNNYNPIALSLATEGYHNRYIEFI
jgi:tetratricopeptide (TPR) repeat protein